MYKCSNHKSQFWNVNELGVKLGTLDCCSLWEPSPLKPNISDSEDSTEDISFYEIFPCTQLGNVVNPEEILQGLSERLEEIRLQVEKMKLNVCLLKNKLHRLDRKAQRMLSQARSFRAELGDVSYLEQLIFLLNGDIDRMPLNNWPFAVAQKCSPDLNLII